MKGLLTDRQRAIVLALRHGPLTHDELAAMLTEPVFTIRAELLALNRESIVSRRLNTGGLTWKLTDRGDAIAFAATPGPVFSPDVDGRCVHCHRRYTQHSNGHCRPVSLSFT